MNTLRSPQYVALDRDGTVIEYVPYLKRCQDVHLTSGSGEAIAKLNRRGIPVVLVTNQSVISRRALTMRSLDEIHRKMSELLNEHAAHLDAILVCPHTAWDRCTCRKPLPGLLARYLKERGLEGRQGYVVGDNITDIELALSIGAKPMHVQGGVHSRSEIIASYAEVTSVSNLGNAVNLILGEADS